MKSEVQMDLLIFSALIEIASLYMFTEKTDNGRYRVLHDIFDACITELMGSSRIV